MDLLLLHTRPDTTALTAWAARRRWLSPDGDLGYAIHALLAEVFDGQGPAPFRHMGMQGLLAYTTASEATLLDAVARAPSNAVQVLGLDRIRTRHFPDRWPAGKRLAFEVRVRPVIRTKAGTERDLYQYRMEQADPGPEGERPSREAIYREWLQARMQNDNAARILDTTLGGFKLSRVIRQSQNTESSERKPRTVTGPDAVFHGTLEVGNSEAFARLLSRGIGRHRAFGFGMLLLKPADGG